jgi:hypothetical protein
MSYLKNERNPADRGACPNPVGTQTLFAVGQALGKTGQIGLKSGPVFQLNEHPCRRGANKESGANLRRGIKPDFANKHHAYKSFSKRLRHKHLKKLDNGFCDTVGGLNRLFTLFMCGNTFSIHRAIPSYSLIILLYHVILF